MVYPRADGDYWDINGTTDQNFIIKVIDEMATRYKIDRKRVYWSGFSMGSMLLFHCMPNMLDKIAAFAPTSGIQFSEEPWKKQLHFVNHAGLMVAVIPFRVKPICKRIYQICSDLNDFCPDKGTPYRFSEFRFVEIDV